MPARHDMWWDSLTYCLWEKSGVDFFCLVVWCDMGAVQKKSKSGVISGMSLQLYPTSQHEMRIIMQLSSLFFLRFLPEWVSRDFQLWIFSTLSFITWVSKVKKLGFTFGRKSGKWETRWGDYDFSYLNSPKNFSPFSNLTLLDLTKKTKSLCWDDGDGDHDHRDHYKEGNSITKQVMLRERDSSTWWVS